MNKNDLLLISFGYFVVSLIVVVFGIIIGTLITLLFDNVNFGESIVYGILLFFTFQGFKFSFKVPYLTLINYKNKGDINEQ